MIRDNVVLSVRSQILFLIAKLVYENMRANALSVPSERNSASYAAYKLQTYTFSADADADILLWSIHSHPTISFALMRLTRQE